MILGIAVIVEFISKRHTNIKVMVFGLLLRHISRSTGRVKIKKINAFLKDFCHESSEITFMRRAKDWILPSSSINKD